MAGDSEEFTGRKQRRSSTSDESEEPSKRRKHRHHRHHRSRKHAEEEPKREEEVEAESKCEEKEEVVLHQNHPPIISVPRTAYDDMEEGEIVEDDGFGGGHADIVNKRADSDVESGEIKAGEVLGDFHNYNMGIQGSHVEHELNFGLTLEDSLDRSGKNPKLLGAEKRGKELMINLALDEHAHMSDGSKDDDVDRFIGNSSSENHINGNIGREPFKEISRPLTGSQSPVAGSCKQKSYYDDGRDLKDPKKPSSSEKNGNGHKKEARPPSHDRYHEEIHSRTRLKLHGQVRDRSQSRSVLEEVFIVKTTQHKDASHYTDSRLAISDSDDEDYQHNRRDLLRDKERKHSSSYSRYKQVDRPHSREAQDRKGPEYADKRRTISDSDDDKIVVCSQDYQLDSRDLTRDKERDPSSIYSRYAKWVDKPHSLEDRDREKEGSRETWDQDREGRDVGRDRKSGREQNRGSERERERAKERDRERDRGREKDKAKEREREREREGGRRRDREEMQWERERERESGRYRIRHSERDKESDRFSRHHNYEKTITDGYSDRDRYYDSMHRRHDKTDYRDKAWTNDSEKNQTGKINPVGEDEEKLKRDKDEQEEYHERIALQLVDQEEEDINRIKEESRRRRQAILEKYRTQQLQQQHEPHLEDLEKDHVERTSLQAATISVASETHGGKIEGVDTFSDGPSSTVGKSLPQNGISAFDNTSGAGGLGEGTPKSERSDDIFCDDIFGESPAGVRKTGKGDGLAIERSGLHDNWDDAEGYYSHRFGEILDGRYEVTAAHGKGVFSTVVRAKDLKAGPGDPDEVAIKIIRNNEHMHKAGKEELIILKKLVGADPDNKRHCVRFLSSFKYRNHLCLVFESLHMNLREVLKKFGRNIGLKLSAVRTYAKQLFIALKHLRNCGVLHCDIKPDNMLVNEAKNVLKLCDFGNAMFAGKNEITPYLVSRFYRAPEIILGLPYDHPMDIWSVGCCLYELYCGKVLFPGATNNDMLRLHMELKGPFPKKMLRKGAFTEQHFDHDLNFLATEEDPVTKKTIKRLIPSIKPKDIGAIVTSSPGEDLKMLANFRDILEKIFVLDPDKRITVSQALSHPFITGK